ncbi:MAG: tRNA (adenosine(37)-N6)-dimethylallyltransferase MiaA [Chloroflexi bacterium]|nr:tRNA (adenosine(37)-N6)-dimethylallyltransferase MiaA [Chloroflexota bacterium]
MARLAAIVGPTAVGKSALALQVARAVGGEVVNVDSRLFYRGFDIGTAKPSPADLALAPHHLIDVLEPGERMGLHQFIESATEIIEDIDRRGRLPVLVGGTGQYLWGLLEGWEVPEAPPDEALRKELEEMASSRGGEAVFSLLEEADPAAAERIDSRNVRRVIRAIEVARALGPGAGRGRAAQAPFENLVIGLTMPRSDIYERIDRRIDGMIEAGWLEEVRDLLARGVDPKSPSFAAIGYRELAAHLSGEGPLDEAVATARRASRRLVRQQYGWFPLDDPRIHWLDAADDPEERCIGLIQRWVNDTDGR